MGHQTSRNQSKTSNYSSGDSSGGQTYLSLLPRAISSGIIRLFDPNSFHKVGTGLVVFSAAFLTALLTSSSFAPVQNGSAAEQIAVEIDSDSGYYVNVTTSSVNNIVNLNLVTTPDGAGVVEKEVVTTETNSPTGFKLYISSNSATTGSNKLYRDGDTSSNAIPATSGTITNPAKLTTNTWGYTLANQYNNSDTISANSSYFVGLPLLNSENLIQTVTEATPTGSGATIDVYYGAKVNTAMPSGTYTSTVVYTVLAEGSPAYEGEISVSPDYSTMAGGGTLTIATGVYTNANDLGSIAVSVGGQTCTNPTATRTGTNSSVNITCTLPDLSSQAVGWKRVDVSMPKFGKSYKITEGVQYYIPWANLTKMQDMTAKACELAPESTASNYSTNQKTLTDTRDGYTYTVRKLKDGNCWMVNNLRLTFKNGLALHSNGTTTTALTSDNSDFTTQASWDGGGHTSETSANHTVWYSDINNPDNIPKSYTFGDEKSDYDDLDQYKGTLYNWTVATAGKGKYETRITTIEDSICPKGWRMPLGSEEDKSWYNLVHGIGQDDVTIRTLALQPPYSFIRVGYYYNSQGVLWAENNAYIWSASKGSNNAGQGVLYLWFSENQGVNPWRWANTGFSAVIRCVSR